jgi:hypothetical protein
MTPGSQGAAPPAKTLERKIRLDGTTDDFLCDRLLIEPGERAVLRYVLDRDWQVAGVLTVPRGSVTISHYWSARPYNVYHWIHEGRTLAYYCNIVGATTIADDLVSYEDLVVDVLIEASGASLVLDEDDLPDDLPSVQRGVVNRALEELTGQSRRIAAEVERESRRYL